MIEQLQQKAKELIETNAADLVIGYKTVANGRNTAPLFMTRPEDVEQLVFTPFCTNNLAVYLTRDEITSRGRIALVARPEEIRTVSVLVQENQIGADDVTLIGVWCETPGEEGAACGLFNGSSLGDLEKESEERFGRNELSEESVKQVRELENMTADERWAFWEKEFSRCIKCYACRQACPLCYCERCIVDKNQPQWIATSPHPKGNYAWNLVRAFHLAGRCVSCGACEEACPMDIPLTLLNKKLALEVRDHFEYESGYNHEAAPPLATFKIDDKEDFIK